MLECRFRVRLVWLDYGECMNFSLPNDSTKHNICSRIIFYSNGSNLFLPAISFRSLWTDACFLTLFILRCWSRCACLKTVWSTDMWSIGIHRLPTAAEKVSSLWMEYSRSPIHEFCKSRLFRQELTCHEQ